MRFFSLRRLTTLSLVAFGLVLAGSGCSAIGEAIDCEQMCDQLRTCIDGDLDVDTCRDRCEDKADENTLRKELDQCTDCLDNDYACAEIGDECPVCATVTEALL